MENNNSVDRILIDMMKKEKEATKKIFIILYLLIALLFVSFLINIFTVKELLQYQTTTTTETVNETSEYTIDGENNQLNQYNDNAIHNEIPNDETEIVTTEVETWDNYYGD